MKKKEKEIRKVLCLCRNLTEQIPCDTSYRAKEDESTHVGGRRPVKCVKRLRVVAPMVNPEEVHPRVLSFAPSIRSASRTNSWKIVAPWPWPCRQTYAATHTCSRIVIYGNGVVNYDANQLHTLVNGLPFLSFVFPSTPCHFVPFSSSHARSK